MFSFIKKLVPNSQESNQKSNPFQQDVLLSTEKKDIQPETLSYQKLLDLYLKSKQIKSIDEIKNQDRKAQILTIMQAMEFSNHQEKLNEKINEKEKNLSDQEKACVTHLNAEKKQEFLKEIMLAEVFTTALSQVEESIVKKEYKNDKEKAKNSDLYNQVTAMLKEVGTLILAVHKKYSEINEESKQQQIKLEEKKQQQIKLEEEKNKKTWNRIMRQLESTFDDKEQFIYDRISILNRVDEPFERKILNQVDSVIKDIKAEGVKQEASKGVVKEIKTAKLEKLKHVETKMPATFLQRGEPFTDPIPYFNEEEKTRYRGFLGRHLGTDKIWIASREVIRKFDIEKTDRSQLKHVDTKEALFDRSRFKRKDHNYVYGEEEGENNQENKDYTKEKMTTEIPSAQNPYESQSNPPHPIMKLFDKPNHSTKKKKKKKNTLKTKLDTQLKESQVTLTNEDKRLSPKVS